MLKELLFNEVKSDPGEISCKYKYCRNLTQKSWGMILCRGDCQESLQRFPSALSEADFYSEISSCFISVIGQSEYAPIPFQTQSEVRHQQPSGLHLYFILLVFSLAGRTPVGPVFFEQLQSVKSAEFMYFEENVGVCAGCCFDPLCSPPCVSPCGSANPPTSPQSEGAWSPGSPSSGTPPSQLLWKWLLPGLPLPVTDLWLQEAQQSTV